MLPVRMPTRGAQSLARHNSCLAAAPPRSMQTGLGGRTPLQLVTDTLQLRSPQVSPVTQAVLLSAFQLYAAATPSVAAVIKEVQRKLPQGTTIWHDHFAYRTFGVPALGIASLATPLHQLGYRQQQQKFEFPSKKLQATWMAPEDRSLYDLGLPRIFVSEVEVGKLSSGAQAIIHKYTSHVTSLPPAAALAAMLTRTLPWPTPSNEDYQALLKESEYAAWTLIHGYSLNHSTISVHRLLPNASLSVADFTEMVRQAGIPLNQEGGLIKVSPDGLLLQSSTVSDKVQYTFAGGEVHEVAGSYVEFAERRPLKAGAVVSSEQERRDGFEVGNADKIFMSTSFKT